MTGKRQWQVSFWPALAAAVLLPVLLALGAWQLQRGAAKSELHAQFDEAAASETRDVTPLSLAEFNALPRYQPVRLQGRYLPQQQFLLDNMPRDGRPGHHVLTPFQPAGSDYVVMVDRGWRPGLAHAEQEIEEHVALPNEVAGMLAPLPRPALELGEVEPPPGWPKPVQFPGNAQLAVQLQMKVAQPRLLLAEDAPEGFRREWKAPGMPAARHYGYAFQWFALALALVVIFFVMAWPRAPEDKPK